MSRVSQGIGIICLFYFNEMVQLFFRGPPYNTRRLVDSALDDRFDLAGGLVQFSFVLQTPVIRQNSNCFFHTAFDFVAGSTHRTVLLLVKVIAWGFSVCRFDFLFLRSRCLREKDKAIPIVRPGEMSFGEVPGVRIAKDIIERFFAPPKMYSLELIVSSFGYR
jgi:hypothetical protein